MLVVGMYTTLETESEIQATLPKSYYFFFLPRKPPLTKPTV